MENMTVFNSEIFGDLRALIIDDKKYFVGIDIARALGYANPSKAVSTHCKHIEKTMFQAPSQNGNVVKTQVSLIPEGDVYRLIIKSKLPSAEKFESWVFDEVLPQLNNKGVVIMENATDEAISFEAKFGNRRLRKTIQQSDDLRGLFEEYMELSLVERKAKRINNQDRINACKIFSDEINNKLINNATQMRGSELLYLQELLTDIADAKLELSNRLNGGKKSAQTKKINKLEEELRKEDNLDDYYCIDMHSWSVNYMYDNRGGVKVKTKGYGTWRQNMYFQLSRTLPKEYPNVDFTQPIVLSLGFVALEKFDVDNLCKGVQDAISKDFYGFDDNLIWEVRARRIDTCSTYEDGKIYIKIENMQ